MFFLFLIFSSVDPRYHTYGEMVDELTEANLRYSAISAIYTVGYSQFFRLPLLAIKISDNPLQDEDEPALLFNGIHHACELIGVEVCLYMMWDLLSRYDTSPQVKRWIDSCEIWIFPMVNPDGHYINITGRDTIWRKNLRDNNNSGRFEFDQDGVDLNRNYDFLWARGGNDIPGNRNYRGPYPFSESEVIAVRDLAEREKFVFDICYHSDIDPQFGETVIYPWIWGEGPIRFAPDFPHIKPVAESVAFRIINDLGNGTYTPIYGQAIEGGLSRNWLYYKLGTFSFTIEVSTGYQPPGYRVDSICQRVLVGSYYLFDRALGSGIIGRITDSITGEPLVAEVRILQAFAPEDTIFPRYSDSLYGRYRRILNPGYYTVEVIKNNYAVKRIDSVRVVEGAPTVLDIQLAPRPGIEENSEFGIRNSKLKIYPNPFTGSTVLRLPSTVLRAPSSVVRIYDINGRLVKSFSAVDGQRQTESGIVWDRTDLQKKRVSNGIYFIKLFLDNDHLSASGGQKLILTK